MINFYKNDKLAIRNWEAYAPKTVRPIFTAYGSDTLKAVLVKYNQAFISSFTKYNCSRLVALHS